MIDHEDFKKNVIFHKHDELAWQWLEYYGYNKDDYMYMYTYNCKHYFKHIETRQYVSFVESYFKPGVSYAGRCCTFDDSTIDSYM